MPNGGRIIIDRTQQTDGNFALRTSQLMQIQPGPDRIDRAFQGNNRGIVAPRQVNSFPGTGELQQVGHAPLIHIAQGITPIPGGGIDDRAQIPAVFAGNPLP